MITKKYVNCYIENNKDEILLLQRAPHHKIGPNKVAGVGGKLEPGESVEQGCRREVEEETGITDLTNLNLRCVLRWCNVDDHDMLAFIFTATTESEPTNYNPREGRLFWCRKEDITKQNVFPDVRIYINKMWPSKKKLYGKFTYKGDKVMEHTLGTDEHVLGYGEKVFLMLETAK